MNHWQVCSRFREIVRDAVELQYCIELAADGLEDGIECSLSTADRLARLLELRVRWRHLDWTRVVQLSPLPPNINDSYKILDGVCATYLHPGDGALRARRLSLTWLPTSTNPNPRTIVTRDTGLDIEDLVMDPSQDLIALMTKDEPSNR